MTITHAQASHTSTSMQCPKLPTIPYWTSTLVMTVPPPTPYPSDLQLYTDGSKTDRPGKWGTGAGYVVMRGMEVVQERWVTLCHTKTVFQAEVMAITVGIRSIMTLISSGDVAPVASIVVYSDSQSALKALAAPIVSSRTVLECLQTLSTASSLIDLRLEWVRAHRGNMRNERADVLAKQGAATPRPVEGPGPFHTVPASFTRTHLHHYSTDLWAHNWNFRQPCRQSKIFFKGPDRKRGRAVTNLSREDAGLYIRWTTGHAFLGYHNSLIAPELHDPRCQLCFNALESASHLLLDCPALEDIRRNILRTLHTPHATDMSVPALLSLIGPHRPSWKPMRTLPPK
jgi:ribonuclease HI